MTVFIFSCIALGVIAAAPVGPLCILIFNRSARHGFWAGWITGLGSSLADASYCALGLAGVLQSLGTHMVALNLLYRAGGVVLCAVGAVLMRSGPPPSSHPGRVLGYGAYFAQGLTLTILNPLAAIFFMTAGMNLVSLLCRDVGVVDIVLGAGSVGLGAALTVGSVSVLGVMANRTLSRKRIGQMRFLSGIVLLCIGLTLLSGLGLHTPVIFTQLSQLFS